MAAVMNVSVDDVLSSMADGHGTKPKPVLFEVVTAEQFVVLNKIIAIVTVIIALSGVSVNILNIKTFLLLGVDDGVTVTFMALSVADLCYCLVTFIQTLAFFLSSMESGSQLNFDIDPFAVTFFSANVGVVVYMVTTLTTTYLATVRCLCVVKPLHFRHMFTRYNSALVLGAFAVIAVASQAPVFAHMGMTSTFDPKVNRTRLVLWLSKNRERIKDIVRVIFDTYLSLISQVIVVVCVIVMVSTLRKSVRFRHMQEIDRGDIKDTKLSGKELSVVQQVVTISTIYIVCNVCKIFTAFFTLVNPDFDMGKPYQYFYLLMSSGRTAFDCLNSNVNFYVYLVFNSKFRSLCCKLRGQL